MIVKMNKLTLICTAGQQEQTLNELRQLKAVHIEHIQSPSGDTVEKSKQALAHIEKAKLALASYNTPISSDIIDADIADEVWTCLHEETELKERLQSLQSELERVKPFGQFNPESLQNLIDTGLTVKLCQHGIKETVSWPQNVEVIEINRDKSNIYAICIAKHSFDLPCSDMPIPAMSLAELTHEIEVVKQKLQTLCEKMTALAGSRNQLEELYVSQQDELAFQEVKQGMATTEHLVYLQGYIPIDQIDAFEAAALQQGWGYVLDKIGPDDHPPTLLRNPKWVDPIKAVLGVIGVVPGYKELDVSAVFLLFLSIFFALLIGDAGYGLLFIGLTLFAQRKNKQAPSYIFNLLYIMSSCTVVWGVLTGTYFGVNFEYLPASLQHLSNNWLRGYGDNTLAIKNIMFFCFVLGTVHLVIGHVWNFIRKINSWAALADLGWICSTLTMFFAVRMMVLGGSFPSTMLYVLGAGLFMIVLSLVMEKEYFGLVTLALDVISNFVDIISYVRLYAVGAASFAIANAFNTMAIEALGNNGVVVGGLIAALALFGGHALNILLCAMGILVHGIRLNTLEFSSHAGVQWGGIHYNPFKRTNEKI